ncbi:MAG: M23 family metallopeptidase [Treponema sp.]|nr:M23 family metallopeptidase [Treponema sp.]
MRNRNSGISFDSSFSQNVWPRQTLRQSRRQGRGTGAENGKAAGRKASGGFIIPLSWVKNLAIAAGVLVIGIVGTNWDSIAGGLKLYGVSQASLQDRAAYQIMEAAFEPVLPWAAPPSPAAAERAPASYEDAPLNLTETFNWSEYQVKTGDTVSGIASRFSVSSGSLIAFNNLKEAWNIRAGTILRIPNMDGIPYTVQKNDSLSKIAAKLKVPQNAILDANNLASDTIRSGEVLFIPGARMDANEFDRAFRRDSSRRAVERPLIFPVAGRITSGYGWREDPVRPRPGEKTFHKAVDIGGKMGDPVKAAMNGTVLHIDNNPNLGNFIILRHGEYQTLYAHLSAYSVSAGEAVTQGQEIGKIGDSGYTTGPHLHFEVFRNGNRINPLDLMR